MTLPTPPATLEQDWSAVLQRLPVNNLSQRALQTQAFVRARKVTQVSDLLRLVLLYAVCGWPLVLVCIWATLHEVADLSPVALRKRLQGCHMWLSHLVAAWLLERPQQVGRARYVRLVDATCANRPGTTGSDLRLHLDVDLATGSVDGIETTDASQGETLVRHPTHPGCISVADCGYAHRRGLGAVAVAGGAYVVRLNWQNLPLCDASGERLDLLAFLRGVPATEPAEMAVLLATPDGTFAGRVVACRLSAAQTAENRRRARYHARKKGRTPDHRTLEAAAFLFLITNLPLAGYAAADVLQLYRLRWQIEIKIKRLKSIWQVAQLRAHCPILCQVVLLGRLLAVLLAEDLNREMAERFSIWFCSPSRPVSIWRLDVLWREVVLDALCGRMSLAAVLAALPLRLERYVRDGPRHDRQRQDILARSLLHRLLS